MDSHPMRLKNLAEAVIVQSMEDLWSPIHKKESVDFFMGEGFRLACDMAGMSAVDRLRLLLILRRSSTPLKLGERSPIGHLRKMLSTK